MQKLSDEELEQLLRDETTLVSDFFANTLKGGTLAPMLSVFVSGDKRIVIGLADGLPEDKHGYLRNLGKAVAVRQPDVIGALIVSEAWMRVISPAEAWRSRKEGITRPSQSPDRIECVAICIRSIDGRGALASGRIIGDGAGRTVANWDFVGVKGSEKGQDNLLGSFFEGYREQLSLGNADPGNADPSN